MAGTVNTNVDMANHALSHLKEPAILAFDNSNVPARWFLRNYDAVKDAALAMNDWDFAMKLASLGVNPTAPAFRWLYQYTIPSDCVRVPKQRERGDPEGPKIKMEVIGLKLMTDYAAPFPFRYVSRETPESSFSPLFVRAFGYLLAAGAAHVVAGKNSLVQTMEDKAVDAFKMAGVEDAAQSLAEPIEAHDILEDR